MKHNYNLSQEHGCLKRIPAVILENILLVVDWPGWVNVDSSRDKRMEKAGQMDRK